MLNPAKLAWGLKRACVELGVRIYENTPALDLTAVRRRMAVRTPYGRVRARRVALGTNVFPSLVRRVRPYTVPVYDYALMTEPLSDEQLASIGWKGRQGLGDSANQFHYFRLTADNRILWGGYDAIYPYGGRVARRVRPPAGDVPQARRALLRRCFPQLEGVRFSHAWGGAIDTCSRFSAVLRHGARRPGRLRGRVHGPRRGRHPVRRRGDARPAGGEQTERTKLEMVRRKPLPFPPEPVAWAGIALTQWSLARADAHGGRRNLWLRTMDRLGLGFDS